MASARAELSSRGITLQRRGVTSGEVAALVALTEPLLALLGRAVGPRLGIHSPLRTLDAVVADRRGGIQAVGNVRRGELADVASLNRVVRPHARQAVGLQLDADGATARSAGVRLP